MRLYVVRRVKCDESRPACVRCKKNIVLGKRVSPLRAATGTSTGRKCDGYETASTVLAKPVLSLLRNLPRFSNGFEAHYLQFFSEQTIGQLTTFFPDDLWRTHVLQIAESDDSIRHALLSLSAYHKTYITQSVEDDTIFAMRHYNKSIGSLRHSGFQSSLTLNHLLSCSIFICIEVCHPFRNLDATD